MKLYFYYSPMNSGKSMLLLAKAHNFDERGIDYLIIKSKLDSRDEGVIHSRALGDKPCRCVERDENIFNVVRDSIEPGKNLQWVLVDEAQFLTTKQVDELSDIVDYLDINVICYGLRTDFQTHLFEGSKRLFEIADSIEEIKSQCSCSKKNIFNVRLDKDGNIVTEGKQIEVGGEDKYTTMCRKCYKEKLNNQIMDNIVAPFKKKND